MVQIPASRPVPRLPSKALRRKPDKVDQGHLNDLLDCRPISHAQVLRQRLPSKIKEAKPNSPRSQASLVLSHGISKRDMASNHAEAGGVHRPCRKASNKPPLQLQLPTGSCPMQLTAPALKAATIPKFLKLKAVHLLEACRQHSRTYVTWLGLHRMPGCCPPRACHPPH